MLTQRAKIHEAREGDDPEVRGIDYVTTIELEEALALTTRRVSTVSNRELTKRPSANQLFMLDIRLETIVSASRLNWYPSGPGGAAPPAPGNSRFSM